MYFSSIVFSFFISLLRKFPSRKSCLLKLNLLNFFFFKCFPPSSLWSIYSLNCCSNDILSIYLWRQNQILVNYFETFQIILVLSFRFNSFDNNCSSPKVTITTKSILHLQIQHKLVWNVGTTNERKKKQSFSFFDFVYMI